MFTYDPLQDKSREIRLVRLDPSTFAADSPDDTAAPETISLEMRQVSMNDEVEYAALSYTWGNPQDTEEILVKGAPFSVTRNLAAALKQFHQQKLQSWLWIDAICIDMSNAVERHLQVGSMKAIYSQASLVHIWLGPGCMETDLAMDLIARLGPAAVACDVASLFDHHAVPPEVWSYIKKRAEAQNLNGGIEDTPGPALGMFLYDLFEEEGLSGNREPGSGRGPLKSGIGNILRRDYWHRIWAFQEVILSREALVHVGTRTVSLGMFDAIFTALWSYWIHDLRRLQPRWNNILAGLVGTLYTIKGLDTRRWMRFPSGPMKAKLANILWERRGAPNRPFYSATDPRDILYGLLGIIPAEQAKRVRVDYEKPIAEVFAEITRLLLDESSSLERPDPHAFYLDSCLPGEIDGPLPTWVPDWREVGKYGVRTWEISYCRDFKAAGNIPQPASTPNIGVGSLGILCKTGCRVDVITDVMEPPEWIQFDRYSASQIRDADTWVQQIARFVGLGPESGPGEDYIWRTANSRSTHRVKPDEDIRELVRKFMRQESIDARSLTKKQVQFIYEDFGRRSFDWAPPAGPSDDELERIAREWRRNAGTCSRNRTFFKTAKEMFGLGHLGVEIGDIVTLIWGVRSPIVLRQRADGGFYFRGDAYVDWIMHGEFLATCNPAHEEFSIH
ncbi:unnamed protein product [Clonostachys rosea f. rosea IK726]|uniref:Heterokaryon incompatibility domain-containing protein n=2 Tax=Bionectria ochroleuca TaxID=29856 RepID=A0A0B7K5H3_BIOOC|nr:unnamed protein product [Clonostachys rosea f. rosea IK726]